ncbi:MAG: RlmE family RNA methyltransferase [Theionarchaea archaeon]|nr:RlmE family RNA methyltransferase [Theionarchaea archaeon]
MRKRRRDQYYRKAKADGYPSRASYKLIQLNQKSRLIRSGDKVLDLGSAPGGWSLAAGEIVGGRGLVVGVDLVESPPPKRDNIFFVLGDMMEETTLQRIKALSETFDVVISDASPSISGVWSRDHLLSIDLARRALEICGDLLRPGGNFVTKVFQGEELDHFHRQVKEEFEKSKRSKPGASRGESSEIYIVGLGYKGDRQSCDGFQ